MVNPTQILQTELDDTTEQTLGQVTDVQYPNFIYCLVNRKSKISLEKQTPIDYPKAESETLSLDWTFFDNGISIFNLNLEESVFCSRMRQDKWLVQTRVVENGEYTGYQWTSNPNTEELLQMLKVFFSQGQWYARLSWYKVRWETESKV